MTVSKSGGVKVSSFTLCVLYSRPSALPFLCILIFKVVPGCCVHWDVQDVQGGLGWHNSTITRQDIQVKNKHKSTILHFSSLTVTITYHNFFVCQIINALTQCYGTMKWIWEHSLKPWLDWELQKHALFKDSFYGSVLRGHLSTMCVCAYFWWMNGLTIRTYLEPFLHLAPIAIGLLVAISPLKYDLYNPSPWVAWSSIGEFHVTTFLSKDFDRSTEIRSLNYKYQNHRIAGIFTYYGIPGICLQPSSQCFWCFLSTIMKLP